jgi:RNA polymerase sigma-70 factor (ECF subfamily)
LAIRPVHNEKELLNLVVRGDSEAFGGLFHAYHQQLGEYVYQVTESIELTEDIVQDVFIKVWTGRSQLTALDSFTDWLFILARNHTINNLRKKINEHARHREWMEQFDKEEMPETEDATETYRKLLADAVDRLPAQQQRVYRLSRQERLTYEQIAERLKIAPSTVKSHMQEALRSIKDQLKGPVDPVIIFILLSPLIIT